MIVAVNTRFLLIDQLEGMGHFIAEIFRRIVKDHPEHQFIFIFDRPREGTFITGPNIKAVVTGPPARHPLLWKLWYDIKIPAVLKKYKADVFVSCDGFCSLSTKVPQCMVIHDLAYLHVPQGIKRSHLFFYKKFTPKFLEKVKTVVTVSNFSKQDILAHSKIGKEKIEVVPNGVRDIFCPLSVDRKTAVKAKYTEGREYFVYTGAIHPRKNLMNLLKAFSLFKKRQQTGMKLVLAGRLAWKYDSFVESLKSYKYRDDVVMTGYLDDQELAAVTAAAYAMVYPSLFEGFGVPVIEAIKCEVPVITSAGSAMQEITNGAALYADPESFQDIAEQMKRLYKDEDLRTELITKGKEVVKKYDWQQSADLLWQCIERTAD